jgi:hypothetical protein
MLSTSPAWDLWMPVATGDGKKSVEEMLGEMLREIAVLVLVFVPLDTLLAPGSVPDNSVAVVVKIFLAAAVLGILLERLRD